MKNPTIDPSVPVSRADNLLKKAFYISLAAMLLITWISGFNVGFHQDEIDMNNYGQANYAYYGSGGKDTSFMGSAEKGAKIYYLLKYYGGAFDYMAVGLNKLTGQVNGPQEFNNRHLVNQLVAIIGILFASLIARKIAGWRAALFTAWLLFLTPFYFGHALFNTKDMPFSSGYIATLYFMMCLLDELPSPTWKTTIGFMIAFAFTTDTRIGGLMLLFYLFVFMAVYLLTNKAMMTATLKNAKLIVLQLSTAIIGGMALVVISWPFLLRNPIHNIIETLGVVKKFPLKIKINFEGAVTDSLHLPDYYLPKFILITVPLFITIAFVAGIVIYFFNRKEYDIKKGGLILLAVVFPVAYAISSHVAVYTGWRHFLFIYPGMCVIAGIGLTRIAEQLKKPALQIAMVVACALCLAKPVMWSIRNHPYEYTYFNTWEGGFKNAFYGFENDYWQITLKKSVDWMMENEPIEQSKDTVIIASNAAVFVQYYINVHYPKAKIKVTNSGFTERNSVFWHYAIFHPLFVEPNYLENAYPPAKTVHIDDIDGIPVGTVLVDTLRLDYRAISSLMLGNYNQADSFFSVYFKTEDVHNPTNIGVYPYLSTIKGYQMKTDEAFDYATKSLNYYMPPNLVYYSFCGQAIAHANKGHFKQAAVMCQQAIKLAPDQGLAQDILRQVNVYMKNGTLPSQLPQQQAEAAAAAQTK